MSKSGNDKGISRSNGAILGAALTVFVAITPFHSAISQQDTDWPCIQRKVEHVSVGQVWAGPPLPEASSAWRSDSGLASLVSRISARRTSMEEVEELVASVQAEGGRSREERLLALFAGVFQVTERERTRVLQGIERYAAKQRGLADKIDAAETRIAEMRTAAAPDDYDALDRIEEAEDEVAWDVRIYQDRHRSLTYVCETPVILEKRMFAIGRIVLSALEGD